ncbi:hypothetical protein [Pseudaminobacter sp. NGMCC 1.201702]|uniref:hypothetical protein n=1 Tax=Pseudaminobacter sp. NGMCC 1.201702 TaxID=3391825 RepID=UPI0039EFC809
MMVAAAHPAEPIDEAYVRSLAAPGKSVLVIEYYDGQGEVVDRKGYASASGYKVSSATEFRVDADTSLRLFGIEPCQGDLVNRREDYAGTCVDFASRELSVLLKSPKVVFCRAFLSEQNRPVQDVTCYAYYHFPGSLDSIDMLEEQLVSIGAHRITKKTDGSSARPDLVEAEKIGRQGSGMWADPRVQRQ